MAFPKIAIIGGGPASLTLARLLQYNGIPCTVYELEKNRHARSQGGVLDLHESSGQLALREAGLYNQFLNLARPEGEVLKIIDPTGRVFLDENEHFRSGRPAEMHGRPEIERVDLRGMLLDSLDPSSIKWGRKLLRVEEAADGTYDLHLVDGVETGFDLVVGGDGAWSRVRSLVSNTTPFYSGICGIDVTISDADNRHPELSKRIGGGMCLTLGEHKGLLAQRNSGGNIRMYAFMRTTETWMEECGIDWTQPESAKKEVVERFFGDWEQEAKDSVLKSDPEAIPRKMWMLPIGFKWAPRPGVTLIGDAAHLMTPFAGVGVNVGMHDALDLARLIIARKSAWDSSERFNDRAGLAAALKEYETAMFARAEENAKASWMYLNIFFNERGPIAMIEHFEKVKSQEQAAAAEAKAVEDLKAAEDVKEATEVKSVA